MIKTRYKKAANAQARILDAAENLFARLGYEATTTRRITALAGVRSASVNYYFATKHDLAIAVVDRRFDELRLLREKRLGAIKPEAASGQKLLGIVEAFILPIAEKTQTDPEGWGNYNRIVAQLAASGEWNKDPYLQKVNDSARRFITAFREAFPNSPSHSEYKAYQFMLGAVLIAFASDGSDRALQNSQKPLPPTSSSPEDLVDFLVAGLGYILDK